MQNVGQLFFRNFVCGSIWGARYSPARCNRDVCSLKLESAEYRHFEANPFGACVDDFGQTESRSNPFTVGFCNKFASYMSDTSWASEFFKVLSNTAQLM